MTGTSRAPLPAGSAREELDTSCCRDSTRLPDDIRRLQVVDDDDLEVVALLEAPALRRISISDMLGESSMNRGASETLPMVEAGRVQSSSRMVPLRMC